MTTGADSAGYDLAELKRPPRGRGGRPHDRSARGAPRATPARAGRTGGPTSAWTPASSDPRARTTAPTASSWSRSLSYLRAGGDDATTMSPMLGCCELPPRGRGGRGHHGEHDPLRRATPARAGRTSLSPRRAAAAASYPRAGGADSTPSSMSMSITELPPRGRGGLRPAYRTAGRGRATPARAGTTLMRTVQGSNRDSVSGPDGLS